MHRQKSYAWKETLGSGVGGPVYFRVVANVLVLLEAVRHATLQQSKRYRLLFYKKTYTAV